MELDSNMQQQWRDWARDRPIWKQGFHSFYSEVISEGKPFTPEEVWDLMLKLCDIPREHLRRLWSGKYYRWSRERQQAVRKGLYPEVKGKIVAAWPYDLFEKEFRRFPTQVPGNELVKWVKEGHELDPMRGAEYEAWLREKLSSVRRKKAGLRQDDSRRTGHLHLDLPGLYTWPNPVRCNAA